MSLFFPIAETGRLPFLASAFFGSARPKEFIQAMRETSSAKVELAVACGESTQSRL